MPKNELPADLDPEELNKMIAALARELSCPHSVHPDLVELGEIPQYVYGYNRGCVPDGLTLYRQGQKWRRRLIKEITPEFVEEFRAAKRLDERIRELCEAKGLTFRPWEAAPWQVRLDDQQSEPDNQWEHFYLETEPLARQLRAQLEAEIAAEDEAAGS